MISSIVIKTVAVISTPIFTRLMSTEEFGITAAFTSWYSLLTVFCTLNLTYSIGRAKLDYGSDLSRYIGSMQLLSATVTAVIIAVSLFFIQPVSAFLGLDVPMTVLLMLYVFFSPAISYLQNGCRYQYKFKENIAIAWYLSFSTILLSLALILAVPGSKAMLRILGIVIPNCILSFMIWVKSILKKELIYHKEYWKYGLALSVPLVLHTISLNILSQSDRIFIMKMCGSSEAGIYSLIYSYGVVISTVAGAVADGWLPWFHDNYHAGNVDQIRENTKKVIGFDCFLGLACIALAPEAITILGGEKYADGLPCVIPIVLGIICQYIYTHYVNIELHLKKTIYVSLGTVFAAALNMILNAIFIPLYGFFAAAYTTLFSYLTLMVIHCVITGYILRVKLYDDGFAFASLFITSVISGLLFLVYNRNVIRYLFILIGFAAFVYIYRDFILRIINRKNRSYHS